MPATGPVGGDTRRAVTTVSTPPPLHEHHVPLPAGHELSVRERAGDRPAFLLVHGLSSNARLWDGVSAVLAAAGHRVVAVDQRGHGRSGPADGDMSYDAVAADLQALRGVMGLDRPVLVGQSWGGNVVLETAARYPEGFAAVAAVDGGFIALGAAHPTADEAWAALRPPPLADLAPGEVRQMIARSVEGWPAGALDAQMANLHHHPEGRVEPRLSLDAHEAIVRVMWATDPFARMGEVTVPALLLPVNGGEGEWAARKAAGVEEAVRRLPHGRAVWLDGAHDVHLQRPDVVADHLLALHDRAGRSGSE